MLSSCISISSIIFCRTAHLFALNAKKLNERRNSSRLQIVTKEEEDRLDLQEFILVFINHREKKIFFRYYLSSAVCVCVCVCVCVYVFAITATTFNIELSNFGITFLMWISKNGFLKFSKNCFFAELSPFFYISLRFLCNFEEQLRKNEWR